MMAFLKSILILLLMTLSLFGQQVCSYCKKEIRGEYLTNASGSYHPSCYREHVQPRCDYCKKPIEDSYKILDNKNYHIHCYEDHILDKCDICSKPLEGTYLTDFWGNAYHKYHSQGASECGTCGRLISENLSQGGVLLNDGRVVCGICQATAVTQDNYRDAYLREVRRLLRQHGVDNLPDEIPVTLVDATTLKNLSKINSEEMRAFTDHRTELINGQIVRRESHIYVLNHLPLIVFKAVLAHELLHVYLFEEDLHLSSADREGFCNLGSELVYEFDGSKMAQFQLRSMQQSKDPDYGLGYRKMSQLLNQKGWVRLLDSLSDL